MSKKVKHITVNLTDDGYNAIMYLANKENRNITNMVYILLDEIVNAKLIKAVDRGSVIEKL